MVVRGLRAGPRLKERQHHVSPVHGRRHVQRRRSPLARLPCRQALHTGGAADGSYCDFPPRPASFSLLVLLLLAAAEAAEAAAAEAAAAEAAAAEAVIRKAQVAKDLTERLQVPRRHRCEHGCRSRRRRRNRNRNRRNRRGLAPPHILLFSLLLLLLLLLLLSSRRCRRRRRRLGCLGGEK